MEREAGLLAVIQACYCGGDVLPHIRGVVEAVPAERSVQLVHFILQGDGRPSCFAHPLGHDVPLGRQRLGLRTWTKEAGWSHTCAPWWPLLDDFNNLNLIKDSQQMRANNLHGQQHFGVI